MTTTPRARRAPRALYPLAMAGALSALAVAPTAAFAETGTDAVLTASSVTTTAVTSGAVTATYAAPGVGYNKVIDGHAAGTVKLKVEDGDVIEAFCIEYGVGVDEAGTYTAGTYTASGVTDVAKAADIAVRHNAIAGKLADPKAENAAAQLAIWKFTDGTNFAKVPNAAIVARANALVQAAQAHTEPVSSYNLTATASVTGEGEDATDTVVAVVKTDAGVPVAGQTVTFTAGAQTLTGTTDATGEAAVTIDAPDAETPMTLALTTFAPAGTVLVPGELQAMVTTADAKVTRESTVTLPKEPEKKVVEEKPAPIPAPPKTNKPTAPKDPKPIPEMTTEPAPEKLPDTGGWATGGMLLGALGAAGAGFAGRRRFRR